MPMRQLRSCDFCGSDAAGVYEVLPPELSPTEAEQRRVVLCSDCTDTLETVVDPLLDRLGVETGDGGSAADAGDEPGRQSVATGMAADERGPDSEGPDRSPTADRESDADPDEGPVQWGESGPTDDESGDPERPPSDPVRNGIPEIDTSDGEPAETGTAEQTVAGDGDDADSDGSDADGADEDGTDAADPAGVTESDDSTPGGEPEEFRTVMRLLGNREFPVERDAIVDLAASAYELDEKHVNRILDHAVDRGVIADDGGTLRRN